MYGVQAAMNAAMHQMLANGALPAGANINMNLSLNSTQGQAPLSLTPNAAPQSGAFLESSMPATSTGGDGGGVGGGGGNVGSIADTAQLPQQQRALYDLLRTGDSYYVMADSASLCFASGSTCRGCPLSVCA